jgi:TonB family protein
MEGYAVSIAAHALVIGAVVFGPVEVPNEELPESFEWVRFLLPPDKSPGPSGVREHITYFEAAAPSGDGTLLSDTKEPERLPLEVEAGSAADELVEVAAAPPPAPEQKVEEVLTVLEVDTAAARYEDSAAPPYPKSMLDRKIEGSVAVQYVVDTTGRADTLSFTVLETTHADFAKSVKATLPNMRFRPAIMNAQKVRQLVQQLFTFKIDTAALAQQAKKP